ncbi:DUF4276 family protein [Roseibacillus ishigakijimensis]|uniref:DUF4276 family protein n=1 Tax=Roseibacillus ishigakijimensis TaxID=454146 RepID=A0A934RTJ1_9BACT|nr:DUF4276 family protein [Roseibacillus ishigakijimensis]
MKRCLIITEGQTEERFIKDLLAPYFLTLELAVTPTILNTKVVKSGQNFKGGVTSYPRLRRDISKCLGDSSALLTTFIDYYGLPDDVPGMENRPQGSALDRVRHVEAAIRQDFGNPANFKPFLMLHEFEAFLFCDCQITATAALQGGQARELERAAGERSPEEINERPESAPSKRILQIFPAFRKTLHGPTAAKRIGLETLRRKCPHFDSWLSDLENFARP